MMNQVMIMKRSKEIQNNYASESSVDSDSLRIEQATQVEPVSWYRFM